MKMATQSNAQLNISKIGYCDLKHICKFSKKTYISTLLQNIRLTTTKKIKLGFFSQFVLLIYITK